MDSANFRVEAGRIPAVAAPPIPPDAVFAACRAMGASVHDLTGANAPVFDIGSKKGWRKAKTNLKPAVYQRVLLEIKYPLGIQSPGMWS